MLFSSGVYVPSLENKYIGWGSGSRWLLFEKQLELVKNSNPSSSHRDNIMYMCVAEPTPSPYLYVTWKGTHTRRGEKGFISSSSMYPPARNHLFPCETQHVESSSSISKLRSNPTGLNGLLVADCTTLQAETCTLAHIIGQEIDLEFNWLFFQQVSQLRQGQERPWFWLTVFREVSWLRRTLTFALLVLLPEWQAGSGDGGAWTHRPRLAH